MDIFEEVSGRPRPRLRLPPPVMAGIAEVSSYVLTNFFPKVSQRFTPGAVRILRMQRHADTTKAEGELGFAPTGSRAAIHEAYAQFARRGLVPESPSQNAGDRAAAASSGVTSSERRTQGSQTRTLQHEPSYLRECQEQEAKSPRRRARTPNHWYAVEYDSKVRENQVVGDQVSGAARSRSSATIDGILHAIEDRCAHRQLKLSGGNVVGGRLVCNYHGWEYEGTGELREDPTRSLWSQAPELRIEAIRRPRQLWAHLDLLRRFGASHSVPMPEIPELEGEKAWASCRST